MHRPPVKTIESKILYYYKSIVILDLREREPARYSENNTQTTPQILQSNVRLLTQLSGTSRIHYYKALIVKADGQQEAIVKTFAGMTISFV